MVVRVHCALSVDEIKDLIKAEKARYVIVVACRDTFLRQVIQRVESKFEIIFPPGHLKGEVNIYPFVASSERIENFASELINREWGSGPFSFEAGSVLAVDEPQQVYIDRELFRPITSVFVLVKNSNLQNSEWRVDFDDDKVKISVSPKMKEILDRVRNTDQNRAILVNSIYFGAVMQCVKQLKHSEDYYNYRWAQVMKHQVDELNVNLETAEEYLIAQKLLRLPLALLANYVFKDDLDETGTND